MLENTKFNRNYKKLLVILLIFLFNINILQAQNIGRAPYGIQNRTFQCNNFIESIKPLEEIHISFLYHTFGRRYGCIKKILQLEKLKSIQVHLINDTCLRNNRCRRYEFLYKYKSVEDYNRQWTRRTKPTLRRYIKYTRSIKNFLENNLPNNVECLISPALESNLKSPAAKILVKETRKLFPQCRIVWNSEFPPKLNGADLKEHHTKNPKVTSPCIINNDGTDIEFKQRRSVFPRIIKSGKGVRNFINKGIKKSCEFIYLWVAEDNCIDKNIYTSFVDPRQRTCYSAKETNRLVVKEILKNS